MKNFMRKRIILGIYLIAVIVYGIIVSLFSSTVHVGVDEELYLTLAKSFHFAGQFEINGEIVDYNCVLYSMLISVAYFFYNPNAFSYIRILELNQFLIKLNSSEMYLDSNRLGKDLFLSTFLTKSDFVSY